MKLSEKLIELRKEQGWSQEEFAEKLDVSRQAISRWENGVALPDAQNIVRISKLFHVTADYLLNDDYSGASPAPATKAEPDAAEEKEAPKASNPTAPPKRRLRWYLISAIGVAMLAACGAILAAMLSNAPANEAHPHPSWQTVKENETAPTCAAEGSYDEVISCAECGEELSRKTQSIAKLAHAPSMRRENEVAPTCAAEGAYDEVISCTECGEELSRKTQSVAKLAHTLSTMKKENEKAPTCTAEGSYDEVVSCTVCGEEVLRAHRTVSKLAHSFQNGKCVACNEDQPSEGLIYMSNGNGTCFVDGSNCLDENVVIPAYSPNGETVVEIKANAFLGNSKIKSVKIPETVTAIGAGAFEDCVNLESINLPKKLKMIDSYTFKDCKSLKEITIPAGVSYIGVEAFANCIACKSIVIPASVSKIGKFAFRNFSECEGTVIFENYSGWRLYDDSDNLVDVVDFKNGSSSPAQYLTLRFCDYTWKRV